MDISSPEKLLIANRRRKVIELRRDGMTHEAIAAAIREQFNLPNYSRQRSHEDMMAAIGEVKTLTAEEVDAHRAIEELRLDFMWRNLLPAIGEGDRASIDVGIKLCRARAQLLGLDSQIRKVVDATVDTELRTMLESLQVHLTAVEYRKVLEAVAGRRSADTKD